MVNGNYQRLSVARSDMSMNCALDYLLLSAKHVATTCLQHTVIALQAEKLFSKLLTIFHISNTGTSGRL